MQRHFQCPHCSLLYFSANPRRFEGPWRVSISWNLVFYFLLIRSIVSIRNESLIVGSITCGLSILYVLYSAPLVAIRSRRE
jgi:hypothetical protein